MKILTLDQIKSVLPSVDLMSEIEKGFIAYSQGRAVVPPVGELIMQDPPGDVHIKYGYITGDDYYVIKIASGFYENYKFDLPSGDGLMLAFSQKTGMLEAILLDEAYLTDVRTAVAGAITAKYLAPSKVERIGIVGAGNQARLQLEYLKAVTDCRDVLVWAPSEDEFAAYQRDMSEKGFHVSTTTDADDIMASCKLIVTTTPATEPILSGQVQPHDKQELDADILRQADLVVADSISQCLERGEIYQALKSNAIAEADLIELGSIIAGDAAGRESDDQVTVADLTGVAVQDIQISKAVISA
jgi:ornithine cyclodeaminase